jgi:hypothetical protein
MGFRGFGNSLSRIDSGSRHRNDGLTLDMTRLGIGHVRGRVIQPFPRQGERAAERLGS